MKSSKTKNLNEIIEEALLMNKNIVVSYPACCPKDEDNYIISRSGTKSRAIALTEVTSIYQHVKNGKIDILVIDEVQFLATNRDEIDDFKFLMKYCEKNDIEVICAGLDMDFAESTFPILEWLLSYADEVIKLVSICDDCKCKNGRRSTRFIDGIIADKDRDSLELEDSNVSYKSLCVKCYNKYYSV